MIEELRHYHNQQLLRILEEEQMREAERERTVQGIKDETERNRIEKIFGIERAKASERIVNASMEQERDLKQEMQRLGLI